MKFLQWLLSLFKPKPPPQPPSVFAVDVEATDSVGHVLEDVTVLSSRNTRVTTNEKGYAIWKEHPAGYASFSAHKDQYRDWHSGDRNINQTTHLRPVLGRVVPPPSVYPPRLYRNPDVLDGRALCPMGTATPIVMLGVSGFRLPELLLHNRLDEAESYVSWCRDHRLKWMRFFLSCTNMF